MLEPLARWLQVLLLRGSEWLLGGGLSDPGLGASPATALRLLPGASVVLLLAAAVVVFVVVAVFLLQGRGHAAASRAPPVEERSLLGDAATPPWKKPRQHEEVRKKRRKEKAKVPLNGHPPLSNDIQLIVAEETKESQATEKKGLKVKKKRQRLDEKSTEQSTSGSKEKNEEDAGDWVMKISNREKRQLRKERQKKKCDTTSFLDPNFPLYSDGSKAASRSAKDSRGSDDQEETTAWKASSDSLADTVSSWNEATDKAVTWQFTGGGDASSVAWGPSDRPMTTSGWGVTTKDLSSSGIDWDTADSAEQDIFANIGTWENKTGVRSPPVTFGAFTDPPEAIIQDTTSSQDSPSRCYLSASLPSHTIDEAWLGLDPFAIDLNSDWSPPTEEWGNWTGEETLTAQELGKEKLKVSNGEEEKSQVNPAGVGKSKRKKKKKKVKQTEDSVGSEEVTLEKPSTKSQTEIGKIHPIITNSSEVHFILTGSEINKLKDDSEKKILKDEDSKGMVTERSEIGIEQRLTEIAFSDPWNTGGNTPSSKNNGFTLDCAKTEKKKMKARRET
ncbi:protein LYRIC-like isoform X2 [Stegostoma tigrinum]|uniref:protein LYRIC-like isoform X2 n=1 Tax=Stegostoma tigrinum TaxID=3053191 RepID=UPI0028705AE4|nr:protein LYRIC-like isoform X2 [Stegostoma tigrinum]